MGEHPVGQVVVDLDLDGDLDVVVPAYFEERLDVLENDGAGRLAARAIPMLGNPVAIAAGDLDEDGFSDVAVALTSAGLIRILHGPDLRPGTEVHLDNPGAVALGDLDEDGHLDLVGARFDPGALRVLLGDGRGGLAPAAVLEAPPGVSCVQIADVDQDGALDLIATAANSDELAVYPRGAAPFTVSPTGDWPSFAAPVQLDDDPALELLVPANLGRDVLLFDDPPRTIPAGQGPFAAAAGDLDQDGGADIVITNKFEDTLTIVASDPSASQTLPAGGGPTPVDVADLDGDGRLDVVVTNGFSNDVLVYLSR